MDVFAVIVVGLIVLGVAWALLVGAADRRVGTRLARQKPRRDQIADGVVSAEEAEKMLSATNARRRKRGLRPLRRHELESRVVGEGTIRTGGPNFPGDR